MSISIYAQQSFFNVPNSHITEKSEFFFQQQTNISKSVLQFNETVCYGLGSGFEIGLNHIGLSVNSEFVKPYFLTNYNKESPSLFPFMMVNAQKAFHLTHSSEIAAGILIGGNMADLQHFNEGIYAFTNYAAKIKTTKSWIAGGVYYANENYMGRGDRFFFNSPIGIQLGFEQFIYKEKLSLIIDFISGAHDFGETTAGISYEFTPTFNMAIGYQHPHPNSNAPQSLIVEFSFNRLTKRKSFTDGKEFLD